jgi:hypothetical protein
MSICTLFDVFCDGKDCRDPLSIDTCSQWIGSEKSARLARQHAARNDWIRVKDGARGSLVDLCPNCAQKREAAKVI